MSSTKTRKRFISSGAVILAVLISACSDASKPVDPSLTPTVRFAKSASPHTTCEKISVTINPTKLKTGEAVQAGLTVTSKTNKPISDGVIEWSSSNTAVATVSSKGVVTAIKVGIAVIQAVMSGCTGSATVMVESFVAVPPPVALVSVAVQTSTLAPGATTMAVATPKDGSGQVVSGQTITWRSLSPAIATVASSGVVTAVAAGTSVIEATVGSTTGRASVSVVAPPPAPAPPPPSAPAPPPSYGSAPDILFADFENGTANGMSGVDGNIVKIVADPTGSGKGKVLSLYYARAATEAPGQPVDRNRHIDLQRQVGHGQTIWFKGEFYLDIDKFTGVNNESIMRKLTYYQPGSGSLWDVIVMFNDNLDDQLGYQGSGGHVYKNNPTSSAGIRPKTWHTLEKQMTFNSAPGVSDGVIRVWIDGRLIVENTAVRFTDVGGPANAFGNFAIGDQTQGNNAYEEYRYWNNVAFSTKRIQ